MFKRISFTVFSLFVFLTFVCDSECQDQLKPSAPVWNFHIVRKILSSFEYRQRDVSIWQDKETESLPIAKRQFYVTPTAELTPTSAKCEHRALTNTYKVTYEIELWNRHLELAAVENLRKLNLNVDTNQVHPLPFYQLRIVWDNADQLQNGVIDSKWISNLQQHYRHRFSISASTNESCALLENVIKNDPNQFADSINLEYTLSAASTATKVLQINAEHIQRSSLFSILNNMHTEGSLRYLRAQDMNRLGKDIVNNIVANEVVSGHFVRDNDQLSLKELVMQILDVQKTVSNFTDQVWQSVYWNPDDARPDKIASKLNKQLRIDQGSNKVYSKKTSSGGGGFSGFGLSLKGKSDGSVEMDDLKTWLHQNEYEVDIKGDMFVPKNLELYRLNLVQLQNRHNVASKVVQIYQVDAPGSLKVTIGEEDKIAEENNYLRIQVSRLENAQNVLKNQSEELMKSIDTKIQNLQIKFNENSASFNKKVTSVESTLNAVKSRALTACRICFRETEGSSQCQGNRNACSEWSTGAGWSPGFRDDTDGRNGGCNYSWMLECRV